MADYPFLVEKNGVGQTGLLDAGTPPSVEVYLKKDGASAGTDPTLVEVGGGVYYVARVVPTAAVFEVLTIDFDPTDALTLDKSVRFQTRVMRPEDPYLDAKITTVTERTDRIPDEPGGPVRGAK